VADPEILKRGGGRRRCISLAVIYRTCTQRTAFYAWKRWLIAKHSEPI